MKKIKKPHTILFFEAEVVTHWQLTAILRKISPYRPVFEKPSKAILNKNKQSI